MSRPLDPAIAVLAARQHGNVTRRQLLELGLSAGAVNYRVRTGKLHRVFAGVFAVGHRPLSPLSGAAAAVLASGDGAALSHGSAATLWGLDAAWRQPIEVTTRLVHRRPGIRAHRSRTLTDDDLTRHFGIRVTTPVRTVLDIAPRCSDAQLARAVNAGRLAGFLYLDELQDLSPRMPADPSVKRLAPILGDGEAPTRSAFEDLFLVFTARHGLPRPEVNQRVAGHEVDFLFRYQRLIVELDGYGYHADRTAFERDRDRDTDTLAAGFRTVRLTWDRFSTAPGREAARLQVMLWSRHPHAA